jgi:MFS family permease
MAIERGEALSTPVGAAAPLAPSADRPLTYSIPRVVKRNTLIFAATQALVGIGNQIGPALGALMIVALTGSEALAGLNTSIVGGSRFVIAYPIGQITDRFGRKAGLWVGMTLSLIGATIVGLAMMWLSFALFLPGIVIFGLGVGAAQQLRLAAADMYPPSRRAEGLGYVLTGSLVGALGAPFLVRLAQWLGPRYDLDPIAVAWLLVPVVILPSMFLVRLVRPDPKEIASNLERYYPGYVAPAPRTGAEASAAEATSFRAFLAQFPKRVTFVTTFAVQGNMNMMMAMTALALHHHHHGLTAISASVAIHVIGMFGFSLPLGRLTDRIGRRNVMLAGVVIAFIGSAMVPLSSAYALITAGTFLVGVGWSFVNVASSALISDTTSPLARGRAIGTNDTFSGAAAITLPLLAGPLVAAFGLSSLVVVSAVLMTPALVLLLRLREPRPGHYAHA